jgi:tetratricopeptide (TPR) repeat protein
MRWTGREARILRETALRLSIRDFAAHTQLSPYAIRDFEAKGEHANLRPSTQRILDATLTGAPEDAKQRFAAALEAAVVGRAETAGDPYEDATAPAAGLPTPPGNVHPESPRTDLALKDDSWTPQLTTDLAAEVRRAIEEPFDDGLSYTGRLERLQECVHEHAMQVAVVTSGEMIKRLAPDLVTAHYTLRHARTSADAAVLRSVLARISAMIADEFSVLGRIEPARAWYLTAIAAADQSDSLQLRAAVRALAAMLPLYHGRQADVIRIAQQARQIAGTITCFAATLATMFEGLAHARLGDHCRARHALHEAQVIHDKMDDSERAESFFGLSSRRRLFYEGRLLTMVGDYAAAEATHRQARALYPPQAVGDTAIMNLDRATALINSNEVDAGANLIATTLSNLPADHQTGIFLTLATRAYDATPVPARKLPAPRACMELLDALPGSR